MNRWWLLPCVLGVPLVLGGLRVEAQEQKQYVVVVLDDSGSMSGTMQTQQGRAVKIDAAKDAIQRVVRNLPPGTHLGVLTLNSKANGSNWILPVGTHSASTVATKVGRIHASGGTPLGTAMKQAADGLLELRQEKVYGIYRLLIVTDGEANDPWNVNGYLPDILSRGLVVNVIGVDMQEEHSLATDVHSYRSVDDAHGLAAAITSVLAEMPADDAAAEDDFALLAGLPDEVAATALSALARQRNEPIRSVSLEYNVVDEQGRSTVGRVGSSTSGGSDLWFTLISGTACCLAGFMSVVIALAVLLSKMQRRR